MRFFKCGGGFFMDVGDIRLYVYDSIEKCKYEEDTILIFLHGFPGQISNWKYQVRFFEGRYRTIVYDQRGFGKSDKPLEVSFDDYVSDLDTVLRERDAPIDEVIIVGHSFGAMVAQSYAGHRNIRGLVLIGSLRRMRPGIIDYIIWYLPSFIWRRIFYTENILTRKMYRDLMFSPKTPDEVFEEFIEDNRGYIEELPAHVYRYSKRLVDYDATNELCKIHAPTLIIVGEDDKVTPHEASMEISRLIPNSRIIIVKNSGHLILYERHWELNKIIQEFIEEISRK